MPRGIATLLPWLQLLGGAASYSSTMGPSILAGDWDAVAECLEKTGVAVVEVSTDREGVHRAALGVARRAFAAGGGFPEIPVDADASHATGYHSAGGNNSLSRYNAHREGFVFSDDRTFRVGGIPEFSPSMSGLAGSLHGIADGALGGIERRLSVPEGWFQESLGPMRGSSQFHVKRYADDDEHDGENEHEPRVLLPSHTDPSLVSVIVHDAEGKQPSAMGLQYYARDEQTGERTWKEVPYHGHAVAVLFVGSVLSYITGNAFPATKHRVVRTGDPRERVAATLFLRPRLEANLGVPPSERLGAVRIKKGATFEKWISRVSRNYGKKKPSA